MGYTLLPVFSFFKILFEKREKKSTSDGGGGAEGEGEADYPLRREPDDPQSQVPRIMP